MSRLAMLAVLVLGLWGVVLGRAATLASHRDALQSVALRQQIGMATLQPQPGRILDHAGRILAVSEPQPSLFADPSAIADPDRFAGQVADALSLDPAAERRLGDEIKRKRTRRFVWIDRRVTDDAVVALRNAGLPPEAWGVRQELRRIYPYGPVASHLVGFRDIDHVAQAGVEQRFSAELSGAPGHRRYVRDSRGRPLLQLDQMTEAVRPGSDIRLAVDTAVASIVGRELDATMDAFGPAWAAAIVVDVRTAEIRCIETRPTFDPNRPASTLAAGFDHATRTTFEPGSVVKPLLAATALDAGLCSLSEPIAVAEGQTVFGNRRLKDPIRSPTASLSEGLMRSSNLIAAAVAGRLGPHETHRALEQVGFGRPVDGDLPQRRGGSLSEPADWSGYSLASHAIGYEFAVTPLHLASAYTTLAAGGVRRPLRFLASSESSVAERGRRVWTESTCRALIAGPLRDVVTNGTATAARLDHVDVFGKTGTAQQYDPTTGRYRSDNVTAVFAGGIPTERPRLVAVVVVSGPSRGGDSGGRVAAPAAVRILRDADRLLFASPTTAAAIAD